MTQSQTPSDEALLSGIRALEDELAAGAGAVPDPVFLAKTRRTFVELCEIWGAGNVTVQAPLDDPADYDDGYGGVLVQWPPFPPRPGPRLIEGCGDLGQLADDVAGGAL